MNDTTSSERATGREQAHLEDAHHEICTALTVLRSNVELVRIELREELPGAYRIAVHGHLTELDLAVERLQRLASTLRGWHAGKEPQVVEEWPPGPGHVREYFPKEEG